MKWTLYYIAMLLLNTFSLLLFRRHINITLMSIFPLLLMLDSIFQAYYYKHHSRQDANTAHSAATNITDRELEQVTVYIMRSHLLAIPLFLPFVWFFSWGKLLSFILFLLAFVGGGVWFRIKHGKELHARYRQETQELQEQRRREELGKF